MVAAVPGPLRRDAVRAPCRVMDPMLYATELERVDSAGRVLAAFQRRPTDKVPIHHLGFSSEVASALLGREAYVGGGIQQWREAVAWWEGEDVHAEFVERSLQDAIDIALYCGHDIVRPTYWRYRPKPTRRIDEHAFAYEDGPADTWRVLRYDRPSEQCYIHYQIPQADVTYGDLQRRLDDEEAALADYVPSEALYWAEFEARRRLRGTYAIRVGGAPLGIGIEPIWLEATAERPDLVERKLDLQVERGSRSICFLAEHGFRFIFGGDDFAGSDGPMYSPAVFRRFVLPRLQRLSTCCHECGSFYSFASDGDLWPIADDLFGRSGVDAYHEIDRRAGMDLLRLRQRFPDLTLVGNISSVDVATKPRDEVIAQTVECLEFAKNNPGVIAGVSNYIVPGTPIENVLAVLETIREHR